MKSSSAPVTVGELLRLALPNSAEFIGTDEQRTRVVKWAVTAMAQTPAFDFEAGDVVLIPADEDVPPLINILAQAGTAAVITCGHLPDDAANTARSANLPIITLPDNTSMRQVQQAVLTLITNRQAQTAQRAAQVRNQLEQLVAEGAGLEAIVWAMADLTRKGVILQDKRLLPIATWTHPTLSSVWNDILKTLSDVDRLPKG